MARTYEVTQDTTMSDRRKHNKTIEITYRDEVGETDSRTFAKWMGIGATAMMLTLVMVLSVGMIAGALGVGIGGFVASFGNVVVDPVGNGNGGAIYPVLGDQPACNEAPQLNAHLPGTAEITGHVAFYKDLPLPGNFSNADTARVNIVSNNLTAGDVSLQDLDMRLSALNASLLALDASNSTGDIEIAESSDAVTSGGDAYESYGVNGTPGGTQSLDASNVFNNTEFGIAIPDGSNVTIDQGIAAAHQVAFTSVTLPDVDMFVTIGNASTNWEGETGVAQRTVQPADRTCDALANASSPDTYGGTYPDS